jgi:hypothetical protein
LDSTGLGRDERGMSLNRVNIAGLVVTILILLSYGLVWVTESSLYGFAPLCVVAFLLESAFRNKVQLHKSSPESVASYIGCAIYVVVGWAFWVATPEYWETVVWLGLLPILVVTGSAWSSRLVSELEVRAFRGKKADKTDAQSYDVNN